MKREPTLKVCRIALATVVAMVVAGLVGHGPETWGQVPGTPGAVSAQAAPVILKVEGEVSPPLRLTAAELGRLPRQTLTAMAHDGKASRYEGVALIEVLKKAGLPTGNELRGKAVAIYVVVEAADGYHAVFALAELDSSFTDRVILLADHRDGQALSAREGPLQMIVPGEKKHARWVRQVTALRIGHR